MYDNPSFPEKGRDIRRQIAILTVLLEQVGPGKPRIVYEEEGHMGTFTVTFPTQSGEAAKQVEAMIADLLNEWDIPYKHIEIKKSSWTQIIGAKPKITVEFPEQVTVMGKQIESGLKILQEAAMLESPAGHATEELLNLAETPPVLSTHEDLQDHIRQLLALGANMEETRYGMGICRLAKRSGNTAFLRCLEHVAKENNLWPIPDRSSSWELGHRP